ncbi:hypothetical protein CsSME_00031701 [Camellia sinensis var. sinensis]
MTKHDELSDLKVLHLAAKSIILAAQRNYLAHERMISIWKSLREAIADNKTKTAELEKLKTAQEEAVAERDRLAELLARADKDKKNILQVTKATHIGDLCKLRKTHKVEMDKQVDDAEDRDYVEDEKVYESYRGKTWPWSRL